MNRAIWELSGPRLLLMRLVDAARQGTSVVLHCRRQAHPELVMRIAEILRSSGLVVATVEAGRRPLESLLSAAGFDPLTCTLDSLCDAPHSARCFVVSANGGEDVAQWSTFMLRLQHRARQAPNADRPTVVLICSRAAGPNGLCDDVALISYEWDDALTKADLISLADALLPRARVSRTIRAVLVHTMAETALTDLEFLAELGNQSLPEIAQPYESLRHWARRRGWNKATDVPEVILDGQEVEHPISRAMRGDRVGINRILWKAQLGVLLPWVEHHRQRLMPDLVQWLPEEHDGIPRADMEIGHIHFLVGCRRVPAHLSNQVRTLRHVRNGLAHRTPLTFQELDRSIRSIEGFQ